MTARHLVVLALLLMAGGCESGEATAPATTRATPSKPTTTGSTAEFESHPIVLTSEAGRQDAALMPCVRFTTEEDDWRPVCEDAVPALRPAALSVVRPGETVTISFPGAQVENPSGCREICGATATVQPLGCADQPLDGFQLLDGRSIQWKPDLPPGRYELDVYANLRTDDGRKVFTTGDFGLIVDAARPLDVIPADLQPCPASS